MRDAWKDSIIDGIESTWTGYSVVEIQPGSESHVFRALVRKPSGTTKPEVQIILRECSSGEIVAYITNYAESDEEVRINLDSGTKVSLTDKRYKPKIDKAQYEKERKEKLQKFRNRIPLLLESKENPLLTKKKIRMYGSAANIDTKTWSNIQNPIYVPFFNDLEDKEPHGAQIIGLSSDGKSVKTSLTDSKFGGMFHILQWGKEHSTFKKRDGFICESYTTACEIAEAMPEYLVACTAGINHQYDAGKKLEASNINVVYVLDKVKAGKEPSTQERKIKHGLLPYIQLNPTDARLSEMTDFNDFALKYGKRKVKKEIALQSHKYLTIVPEVISYDSDLGFQILNPITQTIDNLIMTKLERYFNRMCSKSTEKEFRAAHSIIDDEQLKPILLNAVARSHITVPRGVGIFKEPMGYVLNFTKDDRYMLEDGKLTSTTRIKPFNNERYFSSPVRLTVKGGENSEILKHEFTDQTFQELFALWERTFDIDRSHFLLLLGYMVQACYAAFSQCTPHLWLRGSTGSGKSYILNQIINNLLNGLNLTLQDSSKAGIEQELAQGGSINCPVIWFDEANMDTENKKRKILDLLQLTRGMFMGGLTPSFKGTPDQVRSKVYYRAFSMVMASPTDHLTNSQDIGRFIMMDVSGFKLYGQDYNEVGEAFFKLGSTFIRGVFEGSPHFDKFFSLMTQRIVEKYGIDRGVVGHKAATLASCLAGVAVLKKVAYGYDDEKCINMVLEECKVAIGTQDALHKEKIGTEDSFIDLLKRTYFHVGEMKGRLHELCDAKEGSEMEESFGLMLKKGRDKDGGYYNLYINKTKFRLDALVGNPRLIVGKPIHDSRSILCELQASNPDLVSTGNAKGSGYFVIHRFCKVEGEL